MDQIAIVCGLLGTSGKDLSGVPFQVELNGQAYNSRWLVQANRYPDGRLMRSFTVGFAEGIAWRVVFSLTWLMCCGKAPRQRKRFGGLGKGS